jgi:hypothetical protein
MSIFKHKLSVASACLLALTIIYRVGNTVAQPEPDSRSQPPANTYPDDVVKNYIDTCVANAGSVANEGSAFDMCACTIQELEKKYTFEEFSLIANKLERGEAPDSLTEIARTCLATIEKKSSL